MSTDRSRRNLTGPEDSRRHPARQLFKALVATVLLAIVVSFDHYWPSSQGASYRTEIGGFASAPMTDGSKLMLNTNSEIHVTVSDAERRVRLDRGEAYFEVAKDPQRPFVVSAGKLRVVAVGTKFSVRREAEELRVVVTEGAVQVDTSEGGQNVPIVRLPAGSIAHTQRGSALVQQQPLSQVEELLSWRTGFIVFHESTLADAVAELNRYNTRQILIKDPAIAALRISGNFRATNGDVFARLLENGFAIRAEVSPQQIVLSAK